MGSTQSKRLGGAIKAGQAFLQGKPDPRTVPIIKPNPPVAEPESKDVDTPKMKPFDARVKFKENATFELSEEDYELMELQKNDPNSAAKRMEDLDKMYRERNELEFSEMEKNVDSYDRAPEKTQAPADQPRQYKKHDTSKTDELQTKSSSEVEEIIEEDPEYDEDFNKMVQKLGENIKTNIIPIERVELPMGRAPIRDESLEIPGQRIKLHPTRLIEGRIPNPIPTENEPVPGTFTAKQMRVLMDSLRERMSYEEEYRSHEPDYKENIAKIKEELLQEFSEKHQIDRDVVEKVLLHTNSIYYVRVSEQNAYGFWHKPLFPESWGFALSKNTIKNKQIEG
ncbi:tetratricopeptide repeat protein [Acrasis kona]|uniref:Tetratricopeptide repeat protein n=1 Tax=Acrasis kona TaxID=1008807 RepID=A0AAW2ZMA1_9EUKA